MEANQWAYQTTPHTCDAPNANGFYSQCDRSGHCWQNNKNELDFSDYGPGAGFKINTLEEFHVKITMDKYGQDFGSFTTTMTQDDREIKMTGDCHDYNKGMTNDLKNGMAFAFSSWETDNNWLWGDRCQAAKCESKNFYMYNIKVTTGSDEPGPEPPKPVDDCTNCQYGGECATKYDDDCNGCECHWSWPGNESWDGPDAKCRCKA